MSTRRNVVSIAAGGVAAAARLTVATLVVTSAYVSATGAFANSADRVATASDRLVTLPARSEPTRADVVTGTGASRGFTVPVSGTGALPGPGVIAISAIAGGQDCDTAYLAATIVRSDGTGVPYGWRLRRWSPAAGKWSAYTSVLRGVAGEAGALREITWRARVGGNPGWYRFEIVTGDDVVRSEKFQVSC